MVQLYGSHSVEPCGSHVATMWQLCDVHVAATCGRHRAPYGSHTGQPSMWHHEAAKGQPCGAHDAAQWQLCDNSVPDSLTT